MQLPILDLIFLGFLLLFALLGAKKGLVLSLCSLAALLVAIVGASFLTDALSPALIQQAAPMIEGFLQKNLEVITAGQAGDQAGFLWAFIRQALSLTGLTAQSDMELAALLAAQVAALILRPLLFALCFGLILIVWYFISHALDLVAKLPVLSALNAMGGLLFGVVEGAALALVLFFLARAFLPELIPQQWLDGSHLLRAMEGVSIPALF